MYLSRKSSMQAGSAIALICTVAASQSGATPLNGAPQTACLTLKDAITLSAASDPGVKAARAEQQEAAAELKSARSLFRPQISSFGRTGIGDLGAVNSVVQNQIGLRASQRVYDFGDARLARAAARNRERAGEHNVHQEQLYAAQETAQAYLNHLEARAQLGATNQRREYFQDLLQSVNALLDRGGATLSERADIAARLADAEAASLELRFLMDQAATRIRIDTNQETALCATASTDDVLTPTSTKFGSPQDAIDTALANSPAIKSLERRADGFDAQRKRERRARLPIIEVVGVAAYASNGSTGDYDFQERVGVDITVPLYSGASLAARYDRAEAQEALAGAQAARARRQLREDVSITYQRISSLHGQLASRRAVEKNKHLEVSAAMMEFERGVRTLRDLIETRLDYEDAVLDRIKTEFDLKRRKLDLLTLTAQLPFSPTHSSDTVDAKD